MSKAKEIIGKFKNGEERNRTSPLFNIVVKKLLQGSDPLKIIDNLLIQIKSIEKQRIEDLKMVPSTKEIAIAYHQSMLKDKIEEIESMKTEVPSHFAETHNESLELAIEILKK